ncbi:extracellular protease-like [Acropora muricata]|uniref:extracellular protease-like n=1 Tax=Acropora muricata TaxID=159855 RepID=UPI0034E488C0
MTALWILLILGLTYGEEQVEFDSSNNDILAASIECTPTYTVKGTIECRFHLKNNGKQDYSVLKWSTPLEKLISNCLTVTRNGKKLKYNGIYRKRSVPGPDQFLTVGAGQTLSSTFQVSDSFDMTKAGVYSIAVNTYLEYVVGSAASKPGIKRKIRHLSSPAVSFQIVGRRSSKGTLGQKARFLESRKQSKQNGIFNGTFGVGVSWKRTLPVPIIKPKTVDVNLQGATIQAHNAALEHIINFIETRVTRQRAKKTELWFGVNPVENVTEKLQEMADVLETETITYNFDGGACDADTYAYIETSLPRTVFLCQGYVDAPPTGIDSKMGILAHELSHDIIDTNDHVYGQKPCKKLAESAPYDAIDNADNFEYFLETLFSLP